MGPPSPRLAPGASHRRHHPLEYLIKFDIFYSPFLIGESYLVFFLPFLPRRGGYLANYMIYIFDRRNLFLLYVIRRNIRQWDLLWLQGFFYRWFFFRNRNHHLCLYDAFSFCVFFCARCLLIHPLFDSHLYLLESHLPFFNLIKNWN